MARAGLFIVISSHGRTTISQRRFCLKAGKLGAIGHPNVNPAITEQGILPRARFELARPAVNSPARAKSDFLPANGS